MKTLQELYSEVLASEELKKTFAGAVQNKTVEDFLKANGCGAGAEELAAFLKEQQTKTGELADSELENVSGGCNRDEALISAFTAGLVCAALAIVSNDSGNMKGDEGQLLCADPLF